MWGWSEKTLCQGPEHAHIDLIKTPSIQECGSTHQQQGCFPPILFHASTLLDRSRPPNLGVPTEQASNHAGASMSMRSTPGRGTSAGPSLEVVAFRSPNPKGSAESPGLKRPAALGRPGRLESCVQRKNDMHIPDIYLSYMNAQ